MANQPFRLKYENNWEADEYSLADRKNTRIKTLSKVSINGEEFAVSTRQIGVSYSDHGHEYQGVSDHYFVTASVLGQSRKVDLNTVVPKQKVVAIEYTV